MASLNLTLRQRKLLHTIQNRSGMVTGQDLATILNASARTIRSDVVTINHELEPYNARIESIRSKGYYFEAEDLSPQLKTIHIDVQELGQKKQEDLNSWSTQAPHLSIYPVAADHFAMLDDQFCNDYIAKIDNIVLPHNS